MSVEWRDRVYQVYLSKHYGNLNRLDRTGYQLMALEYARTWDGVLPVDRTVRCLDIGCGPGQFLYYLRWRGYEYIEGVDRSHESVMLAREMGFRVTHGNAIKYLEEARVKGEYYDLLAALDVIEHLTKAEMLELLAVGCLVLKPGGRLLVKTLNASSVIGLYGRYMDITHEQAFSEEALRQAFLSVGFSRVQIVQPSEHRLQGQVRRLVRRGLYWALYRLVEGRSVPQCIDLDIMAVAWK